jgi:hypothetical protein
MCYLKQSLDNLAALRSTYFQTDLVGFNLTYCVVGRNIFAHLYQKQHRRKM